MVLSTPPHETSPHKAPAAKISPHISEPTVTWDALPQDFVLPDDPVENIQQPPLAAALTDALGSNGHIQSDMLIGSNFGLVATINQKTVVKAPDWFFVKHVGSIPEEVIRRSYTPHLEGDPVGIVMEFLSADDNGELSLRATFPYGKLYFYEQILKIPSYVTYDPYGPSLQVRQLIQNRYSVVQPNAQGRFLIPELQLELGLWYGERLGKTTHWLRWWDQSGNLLLWGSEQAELEKQRAESEKQRAEAEKQRAEAEKQRAEKLAAKLRELGVDPDGLAE